MSNYLLTILAISSCVTFGGFPSRFSKCYFQSFIRSCWLVAFSLALAEVFLLLTLFIVSHGILDWLSSPESLILSIWFCMHYVYSFMYMFANSFCAFLSFRAFVLVWFFLMHLEAVFTSAHFSLTANVSHGTLDLILCLLVCNSLLILGGLWLNSRIRHSEHVILSSDGVYRICFLMLSHTYL